MEKTGQDYVNNQALHSFWDCSRDPNREDVADAYEQGKADGYWRGVWTAIEFLVIYDDQPALAADLARTAGISRGDGEKLQKDSVYEDKDKRMQRFFAQERFAGEAPCLTMAMKKNG